MEIKENAKKHIAMIDEAKITDPEAIVSIHKGMIVRVGKRKFVKIK